jgi:hypothetical protein
MRQNAMKAKLAAGKPVVGLSVMGNWPEMVEILGFLGADCVMFDGEHGILTLPDIAGLVRTAENVGITPIARVPRLLLQPLVEDVEHLQERRVGADPVDLVLDHPALGPGVLLAPDPDRVAPALARAHL